MLFVISEIFVQTEFAIAEPARILGKFFSRVPRIGLIVAFQLYKFVVNTNYEPCGNHFSRPVAWQSKESAMAPMATPR